MTQDILTEQKMKKTACIIIFSILFLLFLNVFFVFALPPPPPIPTPVDGGTENLNNSVKESCSDGIKNQQEVDADCGGNCAKCGDNKTCLSNQDCLSNYCNPNFKCSAQTCSDNWKNQNEEGIDCGGVCKPCKKEENAGNANDTHQAINKIEPSKNSSGKLLIALFISISLNLILAAIFVIMLIRKKMANETTYPANSKPTNQKFLELKIYVQASLSRGYSAQNIRQSLINRKWSNEDIDRAFNEVLRIKNENYK